MARLLVLLFGLLFVAGAHAAPLRLEESLISVEVWPVVTVMAEPGEAPLAPEQARALAQQGRFAPPTNAAGTLGLRRQAMWLRVPLQVSPSPDERWVLEIDYPPLNRIDAYLDHGGALQPLGTLGNLLPFSQRPLASRAHALPMQLPPGEATLYLRVQTHGGYVLPMVLSRPAAFHERALAEQMLQGVLVGLGLCLLLYSLMQWVALREPLYGKYALLIGAGQLFSVFQFGIGAQYLWTDNVWIEQHVGGIAALLAASGTALFVEQVLAPHRRPWFGPLMKAVALGLWLAAAAHALDWLDVHQVSRVVGTLGLAPALLGMPGALARARRGEVVGWIFVLAWTGYFVSTAFMVGLIAGAVPAGFWSLHAFQIGATLDMLLFLRIIGLRTSALHEAAERARHEQRRLQALAHTDALTGLANRRGLDEALAGALRRAAPGCTQAVFLLDLDGFKQVNDTQGHDTGDELLRVLARRLRAGVRGEGDIVARFGGDEFVVVATNLADEAQAPAIGRHLREVLTAPVELADGRRLQVGVSIGWALAPRDGRDAAALLRRADAAMYASKAGGREPGAAPA